MIVSVVAHEEYRLLAFQNLSHRQRSAMARLIERPRIE